ncbi:MAG TPA: YceI family protein [Burkholderiaceae bacterium]|jgi:polyisoprenoid-binding protein YceI
MKRMQNQRRWTMSALLALAAAAAVVAADVAANQTLIANQSELVYVTSTMGAEVEGGFSRFEAQIDLDPAKLQTSSVSFAVDTASVTFPSQDVQKELVKPDWLDAARYPKAEFRSSRIQKMADGRFQIAGTLTIKGHAHEVAFPTSLTHSGATTFANGTLTVKRLDYGVGLGEWGDTSLVEDAVRIRFKIALSGFAST